MTVRAAYGFRQPTLAGRQPRPGFGVVVVAGVAVAAIHALQQGQWAVSRVLAFVGLAAVLCPTVGAAISRQGEFAADRFASDHGRALDLARALQAMDDGQRAGRGWSRRLLASRPTPAQRIPVLLAAASVSRV
jgi:Zn-dependent protease with chaperone function